MQDRWDKIKKFWAKEYTWLWFIPGTVFGFGVGILSTLAFKIQWLQVNEESPYWFFNGFWPEAFGIFLTVTVIFHIERIRDKRVEDNLLKRTLGWEVRSSSKEVAVRALERLQHEKWLRGEESFLRSKEIIRAQWSGANLEEADLERINLSSADLQDSNLWGANLSHATLIDAVLINAKLDYINLQNAKLNNAKLSCAKLDYAILRDANLKNSTLDETTMLHACLTNADLGSASLKRANLYDATLTDAVLWGADLTDANLEEANLTNANLEDANLQDSSIIGAILNANTILPNGAMYAPALGLSQMKQFGCKVE